MNAALANTALIIRNETAATTANLARVEHLLDDLVVTGAPAEPYALMREHRAQLFDGQGQLRLFADILAAEIRDHEADAAEAGYERERDAAADRHFAQTARP